MKKTVIVTIEKEIELDIPDEMLTEESLKKFSPVYSTEDLFEHAGQYVARFDQSFVEGIGNVGYTELLEHIETEVL